MTHVVQNARHTTPCRTLSITHTHTNTHTRTRTLSLFPSNTHTCTQSPALANSRIALINKQTQSFFFKKDATSVGKKTFGAGSFFLPGCNRFEKRFFLRCILFNFVSYLTFEGVLLWSLALLPESYKWDFVSSWGQGCCQEKNLTLHQGPRQLTGCKVASSRLSLSKLELVVLMRRTVFSWWQATTLRVKETGSKLGPKVQPCRL